MAVGRSLTATSQMVSPRCYGPNQLKRFIYVYMPKLMNKSKEAPDKVRDQSKSRGDRVCSKTYLSLELPDPSSFLIRINDLND
jgi:hypothetical protein